jgi:hypothetical protein
MLELIASSALTPLLAADYLQQLPIESVRRDLPAWRTLAAAAPRTSATPLFECILTAVLERAGEKHAAAQLRDRLAKGKVTPLNIQGTQGDWNNGIKQFREQLLQFLTGF